MSSKSQTQFYITIDKGQKSWYSIHNKALVAHRRGDAGRLTPPAYAWGRETKELFDTNTRARQHISDTVCLSPIGGGAIDSQIIRRFGCGKDNLVGFPVGLV